MENTEARINDFIQKMILQRAAVQRQPTPYIHDGLNLVETQLFDSLSFVQLILAIEKEFEIEINISDLGPEEFTLVGNLVRSAAASTAKANS